MVHYKVVFKIDLYKFNIRAKTGGMTGVSTLAGYLDLPSYQITGIQHNG